MVSLRKIDTPAKKHRSSQRARTSSIARSVSLEAPGCSNWTMIIVESFAFSL